MEGKKVFITGANSGIGLELARQLAAEGVHVYLGSRSLANGEEAAKSIQKGTVEVVAIDVTSDESVLAAVEQLKDKGLYALVNNAGVWDKENPKVTFAVNYEGVKVVLYCLTFVSLLVLFCEFFYMIISKENH
jgi:NAD(P)-dependent dehydrogenase (short-subunit alcohol dehydrogenase family)